MFRNINNTLDKKKSFLSKSQDKNQKIKKELKVFLEKEFNNKLKGFSFVINYNPKENTVTITTDSKTLANELTLRIAKLNDFLKNKNITLSKILVK